MDLTLRVTGPCYVLLANVLISAVVYVFYTVLLPLRHPITTSPLTGALHASVGVILVINILFNYFSCIFTNPGEPPAVLVRACPLPPPRSRIVSRLASLSSANRLSIAVVLREVPSPDCAHSTQKPHSTQRSPRSMPAGVKSAANQSRCLLTTATYAIGDDSLFSSTP